jgi:hypothetical protein
MTMKYRPDEKWNAVSVAGLDQGDMAEKPTPTPNASNIMLMAAAAAPPAKMAGLQAPDRSGAAVRSQR